MEIEFELPVDNPEDLSDEEKFQYRYTCRVLVESLVVWFESSGLEGHILDVYILVFVNTIAFQQTWKALAKEFKKSQDLETMYKILENGLLQMKEEVKDYDGYLN